MPEIAALEILRAGDYPQARLSLDDLGRIADDYDPALHEAPCCVGHEGEPPHRLSPAAVGWVRRLWVSRDRLMAHIAEVPHRFVAALAQGRFRKRSAAIYTALPRPGGRPPGPYLRHVAWLAVPAVKGMADPTWDDLATAGFADTPAPHTIVDWTVPVTPQEIAMLTEPPPPTAVDTPTPVVPTTGDTPTPMVTTSQAPAVSSLTPLPNAATVQAHTTPPTGDPLAAFFAEMVTAGRITPAAAEVDHRLCCRLMAAADFGPDDAALIAAKRREVAGRSPQSVWFADSTRPDVLTNPDSDQAALHRRVAADYAAHADIYIRLGVRRESLLALARAEAHGRA